MIKYQRSKPDTVNMIKMVPKPESHIKLNEIVAFMSLDMDFLYFFIIFFNGNHFSGFPQDCSQNSVVICSQPQGQAVSCEVLDTSQLHVLHAGCRDLDVRAWITSPCGCYRKMIFLSTDLALLCPQMDFLKKKKSSFIPSGDGGGGAGGTGHNLPCGLFFDVCDRRPAMFFSQNAL